MQLATIVCIMWNKGKNSTMYFILLEPFSETNIVCTFGIPQGINIFKWQASCPSHSSSSCPILRNFYQQLVRYGSRRTTRTHTGPTTRFLTGDQSVPVVKINVIYICYKVYLMLWSTEIHQLWLHVTESGDYLTFLSFFLLGLLLTSEAVTCGFGAIMCGSVPWK